MTDERASIRRHSKSFALAARLLAPAARRYAERLYAWCRFADDAVDHAPNLDAAAAAVTELRADLEAVYAGREPRTVESKLLASVVAECKLPRTYPDELLAGLGMDAAGTRYRTVDDLLMYCHRVAGVVGLMMCHTLGVADDRAGPHAGALGLAMQLTNIARDVAEDWNRGRLYLPLDWLGEEPPAGQRLADAMAAPAVRRLLELADAHYDNGLAGLPYLTERCQLAVRVAADLYRAIGGRVRAVGCRPSAGRAVVPGWRKLVAVLSAVLRVVVAHRPMAVGPPTTVWSYTPGAGYVPANPGALLLATGGPT